jgi:hypothetical protein
LLPESLEQCLAHTVAVRKALYLQAGESSTIKEMAIMLIHECKTACSSAGCLADE